MCRGSIRGTSEATHISVGLEPHRLAGVAILVALRSGGGLKWNETGALALELQLRACE